jgi:hypothetical protein
MCLRQPLLPGPAAQDWPCSIPDGERPLAGLSLDGGTGKLSLQSLKVSDHTSPSQLLVTH